MTNKKYEGFFVFLICILIGFICITFTSKNSFLFEFQDSRDIQIFLTTARGILDGDVLYRDVFEVKGPYLYALYAFGLVIGRGSLMGVYFIEVLLFSVYLYLSYKIAKLFIKNVPVCLLITAITGFLSTTALSMDAGGQVEELLLPVFSLIIYVAIKYFKETYPKRIPASKVLLVAICFSIIFWMKYTLAGLVLGLVLYLIIVQIQDKTIRNIPYYAGLFVVGMLLATLPLAIYFTYHNAWDSLWDAYFYKLIFQYKDDYVNRHGLGTSLFWQDYIGATCFTIYAFIYSCVMMFRNGKGHRHFYGSIWIMLLFEAIGISVSKNWQYTAECMHTFNALGLSMFGVSVAQVAVLVCINGTKVARLIESNKEKCANLIIGLMTVAGILLLINKEYFILPILYLIVFGILGWCYIKSIGKTSQAIETWKKEYKEKRNTINVLACVFAMILLATYTYSFSNVSYAIGDSLEQYPQYKIAQYIKNSNIENPVIINYHTTDSGVYGFTNTKPPTKWVAYYNAEFPEIREMHKEYIGGKKADFVIAQSDELEWDGYELVLSPGETDYINEGRKISLYLYAKEK